MLICCRAAVDIQLSVYSFQNACNIRTLSTDWRPSNQKAPELQQHLLPGSPTPSPRHCSADKGRRQAGSRPAPSLPPSLPLLRSAGAARRAALPRRGRRPATARALAQVGAQRQSPEGLGPCDMRREHVTPSQPPPVGGGEAGPGLRLERCPAPAPGCPRKSSQSSLAVPFACLKVFTRTGLQNQVFLTKKASKYWL